MRKCKRKLKKKMGDVPFQPEGDPFNEFSYDSDSSTEADGDDNDEASSCSENSISCGEYSEISHNELS